MEPVVSEPLTYSRRITANALIPREYSSTNLHFSITKYKFAKLVSLELGQFSRVLRRLVASDALGFPPDKD